MHPGQRQRSRWSGGTGGRSTRRTREPPGEPRTHRHTPRRGSSGPRPLSRPGPGPHSEGARRPGDSVGTGSRGSAGPPGRCDGRTPPPPRLAGAQAEGQCECPSEKPEPLTPTPRPRARSPSRYRFRQETLRLKHQGMTRSFSTHGTCGSCISHTRTHTQLSERSVSHTGIQTCAPSPIQVPRHKHDTDTPTLSHSGHPAKPPK